MPCFHPLEGWYAKDRNISGKRSIVFNVKAAAEPDSPLNIPCGQCNGCRMDRAQQWAIRCMHESQLHEDNCFITLTFNDEELNKRENPKSLDKNEFPKFMKRLRKELVPKCPIVKLDKNHPDFAENKKRRDEWQFKNGIRYYHCGEYGDKYGRPHYHAILFGVDFDDKELIQIINGQRLYRSPTLEKLWPFGYSSIGTVTFESACYVARYIMKKITGEHAWHHYSDIDHETGEITNIREPEYTTMSRRPGIASKWFEKYKSDVYPSDFVTVKGKKMKLPKYYDKLLENENPYEYDQIKEDRTERAKEHALNNTRERLAIGS